jgi:hypothetical protein
VQPTIQDLVSIRCSTCGAKIKLGDESCTSCKRQVTKDERDALRRRWEGADPEAARHGLAVAYGRAALLVVAGLAFIEGLVYGVIGESMPTLAFGAAISAIMIALFFWGRRRPLTAMVAGLALYLLLQSLAAIVSLQTLAQGVLIKILVIVVLTGGIGAEHHHRKMEKTGRGPT